jgi:hypothetical protein
MASTINANSLSALQIGLKYHYADIADDLIRADFPFYSMMKNADDFKVDDFGGRSMIWALVTDRAHNVGMRDESGFEPGFSGNANDDIDRVTPVEASLGRVYGYANTAFTAQQMAQVHKQFEQFNGWGMPKHIKSTQDDFGMMLERQILGDGTGLLGQIQSVALSGGNTVCTLKPVTTIDIRGVGLGTQRLAKNMKVSIVRAADWATSARTAKIDSNVGNSATPDQKVVAVSDIHDVSAAPTVTLSGDLISAGTAIAAGDFIVEGESRPTANGGGNSADDSGLRCFSGIFNFIDDGTLTTSLYGLTRSTQTALNAICNRSTTSRPLTWQLLQVFMDRLNRRRGNDSVGKKIEGEYTLFSEKSVKTAFVANPGEAVKQYAQADKALKMLPGFADASVVFLGNDKPVSWVTYATFPYGHLVALRPNQLKTLWDIKPGPIDEDGLTLRKVSGKPVFTWEMQSAGNFRHDSPWFDGRISGLAGQFT